MTKDRRKNSRRPLHKGSVIWPVQTTDPMEQRNADRIRLENTGREIVKQIEDINVELNKVDGVKGVDLISKRMELKDRCVSVLAQLVKL